MVQSEPERVKVPPKSGIARNEAPRITNGCQNYKRSETEIQVSRFSRSDTDRQSTGKNSGLQINLARTSKTISKNKEARSHKIWILNDLATMKSRRAFVRDSKSNFCVDHWVYSTMRSGVSDLLRYHCWKKVSPTIQRLFKCLRDIDQRWYV